MSTVTIGASLGDERALAPRGLLSPAPRAFAALVAASLPGALLAAAVGLGLVSADVAWFLLLPSFVGLNAMHMAATWSHVYLAPGFAGARPVERIAIPVGLAAFALVVEACGGTWWLLTLQAVLSLHHAGMQNYGIARADQRATGRALGPAALRLEQAVCVLPLLGALGYRVLRVSPTYDGAVLPGPPPVLAAVLAGAAMVAVAMLVAREAFAHLRGERVGALALGVSLGVTAVWVCLLLFVEDPVIPFFALASGHYVQYLWFTVHAGRGRPTRLGALPTWLRNAVDPSRSPWGHLAFLAALGATGISAVTLAAIAVRHAALLVGAQSADAMPLAPWGAAMLAVNLHHYWLDHRVWRTRGVPSAPASPRS